MEKGAFLLLYNRLFAAGNTPALHNLLLKTSVAVPSNTDLKNNLAMVSLLLNPREAKAYDLARDVYAKDPQNPFILSTYAYSLFLQHKADEALKLFDALPAQQLTNAAVATYFGIILAGSGQGPKARPYLDLAERAKLLPEERNLVKKARQGARAG
jgi:predicted Zn-dependent protease